ALVTTLSTSACAWTRNIPPPPAPAPTMPELEGAPPQPGNGLASVVISTDVPASVVELVGGAAQLRCAETPCALTLPYGDHELGFAALQDRSRQSTGILHVAHTAVVMNHVLGRDKENPGQGFGELLMFIGAITVGVAAGIAQSEQEKGEQPDPSLG